MHCAGGNEKPPFFPFEAEIVLFVLIVHLFFAGKALFLHTFTSR